jgi:hypothetical protein
MKKFKKPKTFVELNSCDFESLVKSKRERTPYKVPITQEVKDFFDGSWFCIRLYYKGKLLNPTK